MESIVKQYEKHITMIQEAVLRNQSLEVEKEAIVDRQFKACKPKFDKMNGSLKMVMDNKFGTAIAKKLKFLEEKQISDFDNFKKNLNFYQCLAKVVEKDGFINKREKAKLDQKFNFIRQSQQYRLNSRLSALLASDDREEFRIDFFQALGIEIEDVDDNVKICQLYQKFYSESIKTINRKLFIKIDSTISMYEDRAEILGELVSSVDDYLGQEIGKDDQQLQINKKLIQIAESQSLESNQEHVENMNQQFNWIKSVLDKFSSLKLFQEYKIELKLAKFGSIISGFATKNTDMDLTILTNCYINELELLKQLDAFIKAELKNNKRKDWEIKFIREARIPLLQLTNTNSQGVKTHVDLIVNNILGVINSKFLSVYGSVKWIKQLGLLIKEWGKNRNQNIIKQDMLSSYGLNLLLIHFLIETQRANLIINARDRDVNKDPHFIYKRKVRKEDQEFAVFFSFKTNQKDVTSLSRVNLYEVLTAFFEFYSSSGKHWKYAQKERTITVDGVKKEPQEDYLFTIKDPFDEFHNPGRVKATNSKSKVLSCFDTALEVFKSKNIKNIEFLFD